MNRAAGIAVAVMVVAACDRRDAPAAPGPEPREASGAAADAAPDADAAALLARAVVPVRVAAAADDDFADLEPLRRVLEGVRVVQLGEQTHGDGATFEAKVRLIQFLHREMGFSVVAFESGMFECARAWKAIAAGDDPRRAVRGAIFPLWSQSVQVRPLWAAIGRAARTAHPLEVAGFDSQLTGAVSARHLVADLEAAAGQPGAAAALRPLIAGDAPIPAAGRQRIRDTIARLGPRLRGPDAAFLQQVLRSLLAQAEADWAEAEAGLVALTSVASNNPRDRQMADNLLWLAEHRYPGRKIIVWGATMHLMRNAPALEEKGALFGRSRPYEGLLNMGHFVAGALGDQVYTIGFLAHEGRWAWAGGGAMAGTIEPAPPSSFEDLFVRAGTDAGFLDLRRGARDWRATPRIARPLGYADMTGDWTQVVDGFLFIRVMTPSETDTEPLPD